MADKSVKIGIELSGAEKSAAGAKKVAKSLDQVKKSGAEQAESEVRVIDNSRASTKAVDENRKAFDEWQKARNEARKSASRSRLASDPAKFLKEEERELRRVKAAQEAETRAKERAKQKQAAQTAERKRAAAAAREQRRAINSTATATSAAARGNTILATTLRSLVSPWALLGTAVGVVIGVTSGWIRKQVEARAEAKKSAEETDAYKEKLEELQEKFRERAAEELNDQLKDLRDSFGAQTRAVEDQNSALERNLGLLRAKRQAELEAESATAALEVARIDADDSLSEEEKIQARGQVTERLEAQKLEARIADIEESVLKPEAELRKALARQADAANDLAAAQEKQAELINRSRKLRQRAGLDNVQELFDNFGGEKELERLEGLEFANRKEFESFRPEIRDNTTAGRELAKLDQLRNLQDRLQNGEKLNQDERGELSGLDESIDEVGKDVDVFKNELPELAAAIAEASANLDVAQQTRDVQLRSAREVGRRQRSVRDIGQRESIEQVRARAEREQLGQEVESGQGQLDSRAAELANRVDKAVQAGKGRGVDKEVVKTLEKVEKALRDGTDSNELREVIQNLSNAAEQSGSEQLRALGAAAGKLESQAQQIRNLENRISRIGKK